MNGDELNRLSLIAQQNNWLDNDDAIASLAKAGEGNMNRVYRASLLSGRTLIIKESLPYVAKYPDIPAPIERIGVEAAFYKAIQNTDLTQHTPGVIGYDQDAHCLCLEDLGNGADLMMLYREHTPNDTKLFSDLLNWLSRLHRVGIEQPEQFANKAMRELNHTHIFSLPFTQDNGLEFSDQLTEGWQALLDPDLADAARNLGDLYLQDMRAGGCLLHGDFYPGSWLAVDENRIAVIDPEFGFYGRAEFDLGVFMAHLLMAGYADSKVRSILEQYQQDDCFHMPLARQFAGVEILRRLFGVAQLPLTQDDDEILDLAANAKQMVLS